MTHNTHIDNDANVMHHAMHDNKQTIVHDIVRFNTLRDECAFIIRTHRATRNNETFIAKCDMSNRMKRNIASFVTMHDTMYCNETSIVECIAFYDYDYEQSR